MNKVWSTSTPKISKPKLQKSKANITLRRSMVKPTETKDEMTKWYAYQGGKLIITSIIYGGPDIRWQLQEEMPNCNALLAESTNKAMIEAYKDRLLKDRSKYYDSIPT
jgi:hypothetical protein